MYKIISGIIGLALSGNLFAFQCYLTVAKDNCWATYDVTVNVIDSSNNNVMGTVIIPQGQSWARQPFTCQPGQTLAFNATFSPTFWNGQEGKVFAGQRYWTLPKAAAATEVAWNIELCYSSQFASVPMPPEATNICHCNLKDIPPIKN